MSKIIPGVPESITRAQYSALLEGLGFNFRQLQRLEFTMHGIRAEVIAVHPDGREVIDIGANTIARHDIYIPVVEDA